MYSLFISIASGLVIGIGFYFAEIASLGWSIFWGIIVFIVSQLGIGIIIKRKVNVIMNQIQAVMMEGQQRVNRMLQRFQQKPQGKKVVRKSLEKEQNKMLQEALDMTAQLEPYCLWNLLLKKQLNTMRMQFYFQLKQYEKADELMPSCFFLDAPSVAMKMTRQYVNNDPQISKTYSKYIRKFSGDKAAILYALYAWVLVKKEDIEGAIQVLVDAKKVTDNEAIVKNWEHLVNGRIKKFSNAGFDEEWYSLGLEEPKIRQQVVKQGQRFF